MGTAWSDGLSALPASYLDGLTLRRVDGGHSLSSGRTLSARVGIRVADRWIVHAEGAWVDTKFGPANVDVPIRDLGATVQYVLPGGLFLLGGAGTVRYAPEDRRANTDPRWTIGGGGWLRLADGLSLRSEVRDDMSWFSLPGVEGGLQHRLTLGGALVVSLP